MHIDLKLQRTTEANLPCTFELHRISNHEIYNIQRKLRHPIAIYNNSLNNTLASLEKLTNATRELLFSQSEQTTNQAKDCTKSFILELFTHIEDSKTILKTIYPLEQEKELGKALRKYTSLISNFRDHIASQANKIKHNQSEIRAISFSWDTGFAPGYFIESFLENNALGPDPEIHTSSNSAFSYAREIRKSLCGILFISNALACTIREKKKLTDTRPAYSHPKIEQIADTLRLYFDFYFPDEIKKPNPRIKIKTNELQLSYPSKEKPKAMPSHVKINTIFQADGHTRTFVLPYFREH